MLAQRRHGEGHRVELDRPHRGDVVVVASGQQFHDAVAAVRLVEVLGDQVRVAGRLDVVVGGGQDAVFRVERPREVLGGDPADPLVLAVPARHRPRAVADGPHRVTPRALVADVPVHVGVDEVLPGTGDLEDRRAERGEVGGLRHLDRERRPERGVVTGPAQGVGAIERSVPRVQGAGDPVGQDRSVPRSRARCSVRGSGSPRTAIRSSWIVSGAHPSAVRTAVPSSCSRSSYRSGDVAGDVRGSPGVVRGRPEEDPRREGHRDAAGLVAGRPQHELEPDAGLRDLQVWVVREQRRAARGAAAGDDPVVGAHAAAGRRDRQEGVRRRRARAGRPAPHAAAPPPSCSTGSRPGARTPRRRRRRRRAARAPGRAADTRSVWPAWRRSTRAPPRGSARASRDRRRSTSRSRGVPRRG